MDLSFFNGQSQPNVGAFQWMGGGNQNQGMNFGNPASNYSPTQSSAYIGGFPSDASPMTAATSGAGGLMGGLGANLPTLQLGLGALSSFGNLFGAFKANNLARDQFNFTKDVTNTNLNNQIKSYNTALEDRARSRAVAENRDQASADAYIERNKMTR